MTDVLQQLARRIADLERRITSVARYGTVTAVDAAKARAKVTFGGETESAWLPVQVGRAGGARIWSPVVVGEQVFVTCPGGDTAQGVIGGSLPSAAFPPPSSDGAAYRIDLPGGVVIEVAGAAITITAPGDMALTGNLIVTGDVVADGISLKHHVHDGVATGGSNTGEPVG